MKNLKFSVVSIVLLQILTSSAPAMDLDEYLSRVQNKNKSLQSLQAGEEAAKTRYQQGDLELSPYMTAKGFYQDDKSNQYSTSSTITHQQIRQYSLGLAKKFSTGTQASVNASVQSVNSEGTASSTSGTGIAINGENHTGTMTFSLSQSLWKDFWGEQTKLRWQREELQSKIELGVSDFSRRQALVEAEDAYWDFIYLQNELQLRQSSLQRAKRIENWVRSRASNGIGDRADVLGAQGLVAARELELIGSQDEYRAQQEKLSLQLEIEQNEAFPSIEGNLDLNRSMEFLVDGKGKYITRLDAFLSALEAEVKSINSLEAKQKVLPDLAFDAQYKTNGYDSSASQAAGKMNNSDKPVFGLGLTFSWALDWGSKNAIRDTAEKDALSARYKREKKAQEGNSAWREVARRHFELSARIKAARGLAKIRVDRAEVEREKLAKGRSVTSNVITAEQEAAEAELTLAKLKAEQRKLEALGRIFVRVEEAL